MSIVKFAFAVLIIELTPGPNMAYLATLTLARGRVAGLVATFGIACGLTVHAVVAGLGVGTFIQQSTLLYELLRWLGVAFLLYLAWEGWQTGGETSPEQADFSASTRPLFLRGFLSNVFNPKSVLFFVSVVPTFLDTGPAALSIPVQMMVLGTIYVAIATAVHASIVLMASRLRPWLVEGHSQRMVRRALSAMLALVAVWLAFSTRR